MYKRMEKFFLWKKKKHNDMNMRRFIQGGDENTEKEMKLHIPNIFLLFVRTDDLRVGFADICLSVVTNLHKTSQNWKAKVYCPPTVHRILYTEYVLTIVLYFQASRQF